MRRTIHFILSLKERDDKLRVLERYNRHKEREIEALRRKLRETDFCEVDTPPTKKFKSIVLNLKQISDICNCIFVYYMFIISSL
jgi:hypothetical protein